MRHRQVAFGGSLHQRKSTHDQGRRELLGFSCLESQIQGNIFQLLVRQRIKRIGVGFDMIDKVAKFHGFLSAGLDRDGVALSNYLHFIVDRSLNQNSSGVVATNNRCISLSSRLIRARWRESRLRMQILLPGTGRTQFYPGSEYASASTKVLADVGPSTIDVAIPERLEHKPPIGYDPPPIWRTSWQCLAVFATTVELNCRLSPDRSIHLTPC